MRNNMDKSIKLAEDLPLKTPAENALLRLAGIFIEIDKREHLVDRKQLTEKV